MIRPISPTRAQVTTADGRVHVWRGVRSVDTTRPGDDDGPRYEVTELNQQPVTGTIRLHHVDHALLLRYFGIRVTTRTQRLLHTNARRRNRWTLRHPRVRAPRAETSPT